MYVGIDIGSTAAKVCIISNDELLTFTQPTSWSGVETAESIRKELLNRNYDLTNAKVIATGYGRISVPFANKTVTEITCHAVGAKHLFQKTGTVIDIGGQDTKVINLLNGTVNDFIMNDKCSAGTGKFIEVMANRLGISIRDLGSLARQGSGLNISSMCTVFAESEIISFIGRGEKKEDIAEAIIQSVLTKVASLVLKQNSAPPFFLTGGLCDEEYIIFELGKKLNAEVISGNQARFAGAIGAAYLAKKL